MDPAWLAALPEPLRTLLIGATGDFVGGLASDVVGRLLDAAGYQVKKRFRPPPQQLALTETMAEALVVTISRQTTDPELMAHYLTLFGEWAARDAVVGELSQVIDPRPDAALDLELLTSEFEALGYDSAQLGDAIDFEEMIARFVTNFYDAAARRSELQGQIEIGLLRGIVQRADEQVRLLRRVADTLERQAEVTARPRVTLQVQGDVTQADGPVATRGSAISTGTGVAAVGHIVNLYLKGGQWSEEDYRAALDRYLEWVCAATGKVVLRGIKRGGQQAVELPLDDVYVPLAAEALPDPRQALKDTLRRQREPDFDPERTESTRTISMHDLLAQGQHLAVIGAPGCGKTTVLQHIAWTLAEAMRSDRPALAAERLGMSGDLPLPIYVPLSLYAEHRRKFADHPDPKLRQLATFINFYLMDRQAGLDLPPDFFATLLNQGRHVILLLDGLDEVPNDDERALVSQAVQDLTFGRKQARFIVTSRTPAYQGKAVLGADFRVVRVLPISPEQVADLIAAAYRAIYPEDVEKDERLRRTTELTEGVAEMETERQERVGQDEENRLVTTPLLVRMLLIVHFNLRRLPDQRAELYMEMVDTLLTSSYNPDEEVAQRLAQLGGDWRSRRDMAQTLAYHMHSQGDTAGRQIAERPMAQLLYDYLVERRYKPPQAAEELVADFVANSRQRGGLLEELEGRYRFSHLSFQEFLAARYLAEGLRQVDRIAEFLEEDGRVLQSWWREPALLTIGYLSITAQDAAAELIHQLACLNVTDRPQTVGALASAELAGTGFLEWGGADTTREALAKRMAELLEDSKVEGTSPALRALAGRTLGRLGDLRPGVGVRGDGLPDIVWCGVPAGEFLMGNTKQTDDMAYDAEAPQHRLQLNGFSIGKYPITNAQFDAFVQEGGYTDRWRHCWTKDGWRWKEDRSGPEKVGGVFAIPNHPVVNVAWYEAMAFCGWLTERLAQPIALPTEAQWEKAARWTDGWRYPWGPKITPEYANYNETHIRATTAVGIFPKGMSRCGAVDLSGNAYEWTTSLWGKEKPEYLYPYDPRDGRENIDASREVRRVVRGGSYDYNVRLVRCAHRSFNNPYVRYRNFGFRVVCVSLRPGPEYSASK